MNRSLTPEDLDLILDNQHFAIPAIVKEALMTTDIDLPLDYATYSDNFCWVVSRQNAYVWNFKNQHELIIQNKKRVSHLRLPSSGFTYSAQLIKVFEKEKGRLEPSVVVISREGNVRLWPDYTKDKHLDANLSINHEIIQNLHLLDMESDLGPTVFLLVTTFGSVFALSISPDGQCSVDLIGAREGKGFTGKLTNLFFGSGAGSNPTQVNASVLYWREGEEIEDIEEENQDALVVTVGSNLLLAYDVANKSSVWSVETKQLFGSRLAAHFQKRDKVIKPDVTAVGLDVQAFRQGVLVLLAGYYSGNNTVSLFISYLNKLDYGVPSVSYFQEIKGNAEITELFDTSNEATYLHHVRLRIPRETSLASSLYKTDGVFVIHPCFVQSLYLPDDLSKNVEIPFVKTYMISSGKQLIGYGTDSTFCYVMTGDVKTAALRLLPKGFENYQSDDVNIFDVVSNLPMPEGNPEGMDLYKAFVEFCDKDINKSTKIAHSLAKLSASDLLQLVHDFVWSFFEELADYMDVEGQLLEKKKFLDYFVLFLKHNETLSAVFNVHIVNPSLEISMSGREIFAELYERISVLIAIHKWKNNDTEHADILRHLGFQIAKELRFREDGQFLAYKFNLLHLGPVSGVNLCRELLEEGVFKEPSHRFEMLSYSAELLLEIAQAIKMWRKSKTPLPVATDGLRWTSKFVDAYTNMGVLLIQQLTEETFNPNEKLKFVQLITRLLNFNFTESPTRPDGHPILRELYKMGEERLALELAELHKDFNIVCRICLEKGDDEALERYKAKYANENFEEYYFNYLNRKEMYTDLLDQKGENADRFIATLDHIRWRRELRQDQYSDAAKTLLMESEKKSNTLVRQKVFVSLAKLSYLCSEDSEMHSAELDDIDLTQYLIEYQESLPMDYLQRFHADNRDRLLRVEDLMDLCKRRLRDVECQPADHHRALIFVARLVKYLPAKKDYIETRQLIWESVIRADNWYLVQESDFHGTAFAQLFRDVLEGEEDMIEYSLPDCDALLVKTAIERKKCPSSTAFIKYCIEETQKELEP